MKIENWQSHTRQGLREISDDIRALRGYVLAPLTKMQNLDWLQDQKFLILSAFGLVPLAVIDFIASAGDLHSAYWAIAFYFSAFWAFFFYVQFAPKGLHRSIALSAFFITALLSIAVLLVAIGLPPLRWVREGLDSENTLVSIASYIVGVGIPEELCKLGVIFWILKRLEREKPTPDLVMFYGLMSGLGFGIFEGIQYQMGANTRLASSATYLMNMLRLTSLPFLHAIWTAIAAYYLTLIKNYPARRKGLIVLAVAFPGVMHGLYDSLQSNSLSFLVAFVSVYLMNYYRTSAGAAAESATSQAGAEEVTEPA